MTRLSFSKVDKTDDAELRSILARNILQGDISVSFRREPSYFNAMNIQGKMAEVFKAVDAETNKIVAFAGRFITPAYIDGKLEEIGYLADLRIEANYRNQTLLPRAYKFLKQIHQKHPVAFYTTMILDGNEKALEQLTSKRAGLPVYKPFGKVCTPAIHLDVHKTKVNITGVSVNKASKENIKSVFEFINKTRQGKQFSPYYSYSELGTDRLYALRAEDFYVATRGSEIIGVIAAWDQKSCRQMHVEEYSQPLKVIKPIYNLLSKCTPLKKLPNQGEKVSYFYAALIAIKGNDLDVFRLLLRELYLDRYCGEWHYFICGLHESDPLCEAFEDYRKIDAAGHLFCVYYPEMCKRLETLQPRIPCIEIAAI